MQPRAARFWPAGERDILVQTVMAVLEHPDLEGVFTGHAQAEVSVMGTFVLNDEERAVSGRIDRMAVLKDRVVLVDYKTNRSPPRDAADAPVSHRAQLAIYREILRPLYTRLPFRLPARLHRDGCGSQPRRGVAVTIACCAQDIVRYRILKRCQRDITYLVTNRYRQRSSPWLR